MKKQLLAIALFASGLANAQTFTQDFSTTTGVALPAGWLQNNVDGLTVASALSSYSFANLIAIRARHDDIQKDNVIVVFLRLKKFQIFLVLFCIY